ncbi:hypothetical protein DFJ58DRAFT_822320 [Suillus subalutaceus]|uniref:uncharacterized protein n=1 Tax=Suillus subalutaceus TaxID=48586 RepID=UPI001B85EF26|nr:uncharacterized protein DFJ58DRAFT_822320 [Suillus subalutaceus]KAG1833300.1 hypothetical protein DFJ58DRAFT_822320 [Suillus subalutaceus]
MTGKDEAICDADTGRIPGFGLRRGFWQSCKLKRTSQEHGILVQDPESEVSTVEIYPWYYIVDSDEGSDKVVDIWVPWKG